MKKTLFFSLFLISLLVLVVRFGNQFSQYLGVTEKSGLRVLATPQAKVFVDSNEVGETPYENTGLASKEYDVKVISGDLSWQGRVKLFRGTLTILNRELARETTSSAGEILSLEKGSGVTIISSPDGADIEIDGKVYSKTPTKIDITAGAHTFNISKGNYLKRSINVTVPENYNLILNVDLALSEADLTNINTPVITETQVVVVKSTPTGFLRVREKASVSSKEVAQVKPGDELVLLEEVTNWNRVRLPDGTEGYVSITYVEKKKSP